MFESTIEEDAEHYRLCYELENDALPYWRRRFYDAWGKEEFKEAVRLRFLATAKG